MKRSSFEVPLLLKLTLKNGTVSPIEFKSYLASLKKGEDLNSEEVYSAFEKIDTDGSKQIQWEEFLVSFTFQNLEETL